MYGIKGKTNVIRSKFFPSLKFCTEEYGSPFRLDRNAYGGCMIVYVSKMFPYKLILIKNWPIKGFFLELNLPNSILHLLYFFITGDFNSYMENFHLRDFCKLYNLKIFIKILKYFEKPINPKCNNLMFTNLSRRFSKLLSEVDLGLKQRPRWSSLWVFHLGCHETGFIGFSWDHFHCHVDLFSKIKTKSYESSCLQ